MMMCRTHSPSPRTQRKREHMLTRSAWRCGQAANQAASRVRLCSCTPTCLCLCSCTRTCGRDGLGSLDLDWTFQTESVWPVCAAVTLPVRGICRHKWLTLPHEVLRQCVSRRRRRLDTQGAWVAVHWGAGVVDVQAGTMGAQGRLVSARELKEVIRH